MRLYDYRELHAETNFLLQKAHQTNWPSDKLHRELCKIMHYHFRGVPTCTLQDFLKAVGMSSRHLNWKELVRILVPSRFIGITTPECQSSPPRSITSQADLDLPDLEFRDSRSAKYLKSDFPSVERVRGIRRKADEMKKRVSEVLKELGLLGKTRVEIERAFALPHLWALDNNRNFNVGLTSKDNVDIMVRQDRFQAIWRKMDLRVKKIRNRDTELTAVKSHMGDVLKEHLPPQLLRAAVYLLRKSDIDSILKVFKGALFFGMFRDILELEYLDRTSPFTSERAFLRHIIDYVDPGEYLGAIALNPEKHVWREVISNLRDTLAPYIKKRADMQKTIATLLFYRFYTCFHTNDDEKDLATLTEKVRQIIRK